MHPALVYAQAPEVAMNTQRFEFVSAGNRLSGFVDTPADGTAKALVIIIQGYGETDVAGRTSYYDLRSHFTQLGIATVIWDKPGCGQIAGKFDADQPVESSAVEVQDAIRQLRKSSIPGAHKIGLWGISRGGWIAPLAITQNPDIAFWISVSGTDDEENFPYLLESNLRIEGRTESQINQLVGEWKRGFEITSRGGSYADYMAATQNIRRDPFMVYLSGPFRRDDDGLLEHPDSGLALFISEGFNQAPAAPSAHLRTVMRCGESEPTPRAPPPAARDAARDHRPLKCKSFRAQGCALTTFPDGRTLCGDTMSGYSKGFYSVLIILGLALFVSGILLVPTLLAMRLEIAVPWRLDTDQRTITAAVHLIAAFAAFAAVGALWAVHMQRGWRMKRNRVTGSLLVSVLIVLGLTGAGIYYSGDEALSKWSSLVHTAVGLAVILIIWSHLSVGKKRKNTP